MDEPADEEFKDEEYFRDLVLDALYAERGDETLAFSIREKRAKDKELTWAEIPQGQHEAYREAMQELMESQFGQIVRGIAEARGLSDEETLELFDNGPYLGSAALDEGLVDEMAYRDEVYNYLAEQVGDHAEMVHPVDYIEQAGRPQRPGVGPVLGIFV